MKKILLTMLIMSGTAEARTMRSSMATRVGPDRYILTSGEEILTVGCTETARDQRVIVDSNGIESKIAFLDEDGEVEEVCDLKGPPKLRVSPARLVASRGRR